MEFGALELTLLVVGLVDRDDDRRRRAPQQVGRLQVGRGHPHSRIDHEHDDVRLGDGQPGLLLDAELDGVVGVDLEPAGVDEHEPAAVPLGIPVQPVAGGAGAVLHDRGARTDDAVEQRALADVRPADDGDDRERAAQPVRSPGAGTGHARYAAPEAGADVMCGSDVVRPAGVAAWPNAASARSAAFAAASGVPPSSRMRRATSRRSSIGVDVPPVTPTMVAPVEHGGVGQVAFAFDLDRVRAGDLAQPRQLLGVGARATADDDHQVDLGRGLHRVLLATDRDRADGVDDLELMGTRDHQRGELLELPGWLGRLRQQGHPLLARDGGVPLFLLVDHDGVGGETEHADDLGVLGRAEEHDRVPLLDQLDELAMLLDDPGAGAVDDLETARLGPLHHVRADAVGADDHRRTVVDVVECLDGLDAQLLEVADDPLVVDDLPEGMRGLSGGRRLLGLVDRLAHPVTEAGPLRDADLLDRSHDPIIPRGPVRARSGPPWRSGHAATRATARRCGA